MSEGHFIDGAYRPTKVEVLLVDVPMAGPAQTICRTSEQDKKDINKAAAALHIKQADFVRLAIMSVARSVLSEVKAHSQTTFQDNQGGAFEPSAR